MYIISERIADQMGRISSVKLFSKYIDLFPTMSFPVTLHLDAHHDFSKQDKGIRQELLDEYVIPYIGENDDEFTEYIPCFQLKADTNFIGVVLWRAALLEYEYYIMTYNNAGDLIHQQVIAGMKSDGENIITRIAIIDDDSIIHMVEGLMNEEKEQDYDPLKTREFTFELTSDGYISLEH